MPDMPQRLNSPVVVFLIVLACTSITVAFLKLSAPVLAPILLAATLAILFTPVLRALERRGMASGLALAVMVVAMIAFFGAILILLVAQGNRLAERLPYYQQRLQEQLAPLVDWLSTRGIDVTGVFTGGLANGRAIVQAALGLISAVVSSGAAIVFFLFTLILMLADSRRVAVRVAQGAGAGNPFAVRLGAFLHQIQMQYRIQAFSNLLSASVLTLEFLVFRIDFALLWGVLAFLLAFVPNIGLILACLPAVLIAFVLHGWGVALLVVVVGVALNAAMDNLVTPRFMRGDLGLPMVVTFLAFLFWSWVFGLLGALLAVPLTLFIRMLLDSAPQTRFAAQLLTAGDETPARVSTKLTEDQSRHP